MGGKINILSQLPDIMTAIVCLGFGYYYTRYLQGKVNHTEEKDRRRTLILSKYKTAFKFGLAILYTVGILHLIISVYSFI